jgi:hypothetical protein
MENPGRKAPAIPRIPGWGVVRRMREGQAERPWAAAIGPSTPVSKIGLPETYVKLITTT